MFRKFIIMNEHLLTWREKKEILNSSITFPVGCYRKNINIFNGKLTNRLFLLQYYVENFAFLVKYRQRKVDLDTSEKLLVFFTIQHLYAQLSYMKIPYLRENTHLWKDVAFLHFVWRKVKEIWYSSKTRTHKN